MSSRAMRRRPQQTQSDEPSTKPSVTSTLPPSEQNPSTSPLPRNPGPSPELQQLRQIATVLGDLVPAVNQMSENQEMLSQRLTTLEETVSSKLLSQPPSDDSGSSSSGGLGSGMTLLTLVDQSQEQSERLRRQIETMTTAVREQNSAVTSALDLLGTQQQVALPDGTKMSSADFESMKSGRAVVAEAQRLISSSDELIATLKAAGKPEIRVDTRQLAHQATRDLDKQLSYAVRQSVSGAEKKIERAAADAVSKIDSATSTATTTVSKSLTQASKRLAQVDAAAGRTEGRVKNIEAWMPWSNLGRVLAALLPFTLAVLVIVGVLRTVMVDVLGLPILTVWLWSQMAAATTWWSTGLWALGGISAVAGICFMVLWGSAWLKRLYESW